MLTCNSGAPTVDGGNSSSMKDKTSRTSKTTKSLMFQEAETQKHKMSKFITDITNLIKDGIFFMLKTKLMQRQKEWEISDSKSMNHSSLFQDFQ